MGFLDNFRKAQNSDLIEGWQSLETEAQLAAAIKESHQKPVMLFKHSIRCGISEGAKQGLIGDWDIDPDKMSFYYLDLINFRSISNKIAADLNVTHQSPQIILVKNGKAIFDTSHHRISVAEIRKALG